MPTDKPRVTFMIEEDVLTKLKEYQADHNCNQSQAIISLISKGLALEEASIPVIPQRNLDIFDSKDVLRQYRELDDFGKRAVSRIVEVEYARCNAMVSDSLLNGLAKPVSESSTPEAKAE